LAWHRVPTADTRTPYVVGVEGRELLERHRSVFERDRIATWGPHTRIQDWATFTASAVNAPARWMRDHAYLVSSPARGGLQVRNSAQG
jgi:hypothetical protein